MSNLKVSILQYYRTVGHLTDVGRPCPGIYPCTPPLAKVGGALTCIPHIAVPLQQQQVASGCLLHGAAAPHAKAAGVAADDALQLPPVCVPVVQELRAPAAIRHQAAHLRRAALWRKY